MEFLPAIRAALGLPETADQPTILAAVTAAQSAIAAHSQQVASGDALEEKVAMQSRILQLEGGIKRSAAETAIDTAIRAGKPIPPASREDFISRHMADPQGTDFWLSTMMSLHSGGIPLGAAPIPQGGVHLDASDMQVISVLGLTPEAFLRTKRENATR